MAVEFRLLGPVEAVRDGAPVALGVPRQRALLALLLLDPGRPAQAWWLADELWHGDPPAQADATLRSYVSRLRRALGADAIRVAQGAYTLSATPEQVDARRFERLLWQGRDELARDAAGLASERLHAALGLWRGGALGDAAERLDRARPGRAVDAAA